MIQHIHLMTGQLLNKSLLLNFFLTSFFFCISTGPFAVIENYGNWRTLSVYSKSAYITGLWDGYIAFFGKELGEKYSANCSSGRITRVSDLVEIVDSLYKQETNRSFSPAILLREKGLQNLCIN